MASEQWKRVSGKHELHQDLDTYRMEVPGGWVYLTWIEGDLETQRDIAKVFVPNPDYKPREGH